MLKHKPLLKTAFFIIAACMLFLAVDQTFARTQAAPVSSHYNLQFSIHHHHKSNSGSGETVQTSIQVHISKWDQNYDKTHYQVFIILTSTNTDVIDVYPDSREKFVFGGWYNLTKINQVLKTHNLRPVPNSDGDHTWLYVTSKTPFTANIVASTHAVPSMSNWRIVVMAEKKRGVDISLAWSKTYSPTSQ